MTGDELLDYVRNEELRDGASPYLWSDDLIYMYLTEGQKLMARRTYCLVDSTSPLITNIITNAGQREYALDPLVLHVLSARISDQSQDLIDRTHLRIPSFLETNTGTPAGYYLNESQQTIAFYPTPDAEYTVNLRVARLPLNGIDDDNNPEIPERLHIDLASYAAYRCLINNDSDGINLGAADRHKMEWEQRVIAAKREYYRLRMGNNPHVINNWTGK